MNLFKQSLVFVSTVMVVLGLTQTVRADGAAVSENHDGVKINITAWNIARNIQGNHSDTPILPPNRNEVLCANQVRDQIFERAKGNPLLSDALYSKKSVLQIDINSASDANNYVDAENYSHNVDVKPDHLYVRVPFHEIGLSYGNETPCKLPDEFNAQFPSSADSRVAETRGQKALIEQVNEVSKETAAFDKKIGLAIDNFEENTPHVDQH